MRLRYRILKWGVVGLMIIWLINATMLLFNANFQPTFPLSEGHFLTRLVAALIGGLQDIPSVLSYLLGYVVMVIGFVWHELEIILANLGYTGVEVGNNLPEVAPVSFGISNAPFGAALIFAVAQFICFVAIGGFGGKLPSFRFPGNLVIQGNRAKLPYFALMFTVGAVLSYSASAGNILDGIVTVIICIVFLAYPVVAGFPYFLAKEAGFHPDQILTAFRRRERAKMLKPDMVKEQNTIAPSPMINARRASAEHQYPDRRRRAEVPTYEQALQVLDLENGNFDRSSVRRNFQAKVRTVSPEVARPMKTAYSVVLAHHGWTR